MDCLVLITPQAEADIEAVCRYITLDLHNPQAATDLADALYGAIETLSAMPLRHPVWRREPWKSRGVRSMDVKNYRLFYLANESQHRVVVLRIFYNRRDV